MYLGHVSSAPNRNALVIQSQQYYTSMQSGLLKLAYHSIVHNYIQLSECIVYCSVYRQLLVKTHSKTQVESVDHLREFVLFQDNLLVLTTIHPQRPKRSSPRLMG